MSHIYFEYILNILIFYLSPSLQESMEEQLKGEEKKSHEDLRFYLKENWQLKKKKMKALKVSVAYMRAITLQYYHIC